MARNERDMGTTAGSGDTPIADSLPSTMRAMVLTGQGGPERLVFEPAWPVPVPDRDEVLVNVSACGMNNTDINVRTDWYGLGSSEYSFPRVQGADVCGRVVKCGAEVSSGLFGRRVLLDPWVRDWDAPDDLVATSYMGWQRDGGYAEYVAMPARNVHPVESRLADVELASFPCASHTAVNLIERAAVSSDEWVIVTGASGGVGTALVQLIAALGAHPVAVCSPAKSQAVRALGAELTVPRDHGDMRAVLREIAGRETVDVVIDVVGGPMWPQLIDLLRRGGRYATSGAIAGETVVLDLRTLYLNDLTLSGATVTPPHVFGEVVRAIECGDLRPVIAATYRLEEIREAQEAFLAKRHVGNIVIDLT